MGAILFSFCTTLFLNTVGWLLSALLSTDKVRAAQARVFCLL